MMTITISIVVGMFIGAGLSILGFRLAFRAAERKRDAEDAPIYVSPEHRKVLQRELNHQRSAQLDRLAMRHPPFVHEVKHARGWDHRP